MRRVVYRTAQFLRSVGFTFDSSKNEQVIAMKKAIRKLDNSRINFYIEQYPDGSWSAESTNVDGIATGGTDPRLIQEMLKDAIFTYYEIPAHLCGSVHLRSDNDPVTVQQKVHVSA